MQPPHLLLLFLFLPILLPGMWADPEGKWELWFASTAFTPPTLSEDPTSSPQGRHGQATVPYEGADEPQHRRATSHRPPPKHALSLATLSLPASSSGLLPHQLQHRALGTQAEEMRVVPSQALGVEFPPKMSSPCREPMGARQVSAPHGAEGPFQQPLVR